MRLSYNVRRCGEFSVLIDGTQADHSGHRLHPEKSNAKRRDDVMVAAARMVSVVFGYKQ